ncbi:MAG TPA: CoA pyrophosphatase [Dehalococcoidia bacterium]
MVEIVRKVLAAYEPKPLDPASHHVEAAFAGREPIPAAVLVLLYPLHGEPHLIFTVRTDLVEHHKGQISFPGGTADPGDPDLRWTALRETQEEIGVRPEDVEILGRLDDMVTITNFRVTPYVGLLTGPVPYPFRPAEAEVAEILAVPLAHLLDPLCLELDQRPLPDGRVIPMYSYRYGQHLIWGATARMLRGFLDLIGGVEGGAR